MEQFEVTWVFWTNHDDTPWFPGWGASLLPPCQVQVGAVLNCS
jgi:hypothetical protein